MVYNHPIRHESQFKEEVSMEPQLKAQLLVAQYYNKKAEKNNQVLLTTEDVRVVWFCYILGGWKCLLITTTLDEKYYEVTYNVAKKETYLDAYSKIENICIPDGEVLHSFEDAMTKPHKYVESRRLWICICGKDHTNDIHDLPETMIDTDKAIMENSNLGEIPTEDLRFHD